MTSTDLDRRWVVAIWVAISGALFASYVYRSVPLQSANDRSRWATIRALTERGEYRIDRYQLDKRDRSWATIDLVAHEGHLYSTKPPLFPTLVAGLTTAIERTLGWQLADRTLDVTRLVLLLVNALPMTAAIAIIGAIALRYSEDCFAPSVVVAAASVGSMHLPFVASLNNHTVGLWGITLALGASLLFHSSTRTRTRRLAAAAAGFFAMWGCCNELPAALFGLTIFGWFARADWKTTLLWFAPAALIPLAGFLYTNYVVTGGWKPFYMYYGTEKYEFYLNGRPSYWMQPQGIDRNLDSPLTYAMHCLFGHHGLFSLTPILVVALAGVPAAWTSRRAWVRFWGRAASLLSTAVLLFFLTRTENYNYGGVSVALRWMLWLTPLWAVLMIAALGRCRSTGFRVFVVAALAWSVFSALEPGANAWQQNYLFRAMTQAGWIAY